MKFKKLAPIVLTGALAFTGFTALPINSSAATNVVNKEITKEKAKIEYYDYIKEELRKNAVSESDITNLIHKLDTGVMWDSINPSMQESATVVNVDDETTKYVYPDGSIAIQQISGGTVEQVNEPVDDGITPFASIGGGTITGGSGYTVVKGAKVVGSIVIAAASYKVDYQLVNGGNDNIYQAYSRNITVPGPGGNYEVEAWGVKKAKEDLNGKAYVSLRFKASNDKLGATTFYLNTYVGSDKATVSSNM